MSNSERDTENAIRAAGKTAPRLTPARIDQVIVGETFTRLPSGKKLICELTLESGFTVIGEASVVDPRNFDEQIGRDKSREDARRKIWMLEGYALQIRLARGDAA